MEAQLGLEKKVTLDIVDALNVLLSDKHVFYIKLRNYHWNVEGDSFLELHEFFEKMYKGVELQIDLIAERIRKLNKRPLGTMAEYLKNSQLNESKQPYNDGKKMIKQLLEDNESTIRWIRDHQPVADEGDDYGTADFLVDLLREDEKTAWMLRSYLA